jgi:MFS family permease
MTWVLTLFFTTILTPGWGIKLGSIAILHTFFHASVDYAAKITALYVSFYCVGRFFGGLLAERIGAFRAYDILLVCMLLCLVVAPQTTTALPHSDVESFGCQMFVGLICVVGLMYGGCVALFYSIVFDVFGAKNYRRLFGFNMQGFGLATAIGGLSCAYSFSQPPDPSHPDAPGQAANQWFYAMAGATLFGHVLLHVLRPLDFNKLLHRRLARIDPSYVPLRKVRPGPRAAAPAAVNAAAVNGASHA